MSNDPIPGPAISCRLDGAGTDVERDGDLRLRQPGVVAEHEDFAAPRGRPGQRRQDLSAVTVHTSRANPAPNDLTQEFPVGSTVFTGQATNISLTLDDARGCHAVVGAKILSGGGPGFTGLAYRSSDHRLSFAAGGKGLFVQSATAQCDNGAAGLDVKQFDRIDLGGFGDSIVDSSAIISPAQRISSP